MLQTMKPSRTLRSNSLNVPDGAVACSIQIPDTRKLRNSSICSCSRCSWISDVSEHRSRSEMTSSPPLSEYELSLQMPQVRPHSECNLSLSPQPSGHRATMRSVSADFGSKSLDEPSPGRRSVSPLSIGRASSKSSMSTRPSIDNTIGQIKFRLVYNLEMGSLDVHVLECLDLPHFGKHNPNAVVYVSLLPDDGYLEHSKVKTKVRKNSHNPVFGEILKFPNLTKFELDDRSLQFSVFHVDPFTRKSLIGECQIRVDDYPWSTEEPIWMSLRKQLLELPPDSEPQVIHSRRGLLRFEVSFRLRDAKKDRGDIHFMAKSGNNLTGDPPVLCKMPFVKANLLSNRKIIASARSSLAEFHENGLEPFWNYDIVLQDQSTEKLRKRALEISVWDRENSLNNRYIGRLLFYLSDPSKTEKPTQSIWRRMLESPGAKFVAEFQLQP